MKLWYFHIMWKKKMIILLIFSVLNGTMPRGIFFVM